MPLNEERLVLLNSPLKSKVLHQTKVHSSAGPTKDLVVCAIQCTSNLFDAAEEVVNAIPNCTEGS